MKKLLLLLSVFNLTILQAQIELVPNPSDINSGALTFKYGEFGDYSIFDPQSNPNLYLYTGLQTDSDPLTWDYNDGDFTIPNLVNMIPLNFDGNLGYYQAVFDPATRSYFEEASQSVVSLPNGLQVFDWYFLITTNDLSRQSADLRGSDYGFGSSLLSVPENGLLRDFKVVKQTLEFYRSGEYQIRVYDILGKQIINKTIKVSNTYTFDPTLNRKGMYLVRVNKGNATRTVKLLNY